MHKEIIRLSVPNILNNLTVPLLGIVDTMLMGRMDDPSYLAAIALGGSVFSFLYWGLGFLRMSSVGLTGQALGKGDRTETIMVLMRAGLVAIFAATLILIFQHPIADQGLSLLGVNSELEHVTSEYVLIRIWGAPAALLLFAIQGWFLGMQNSRFPLILAIVINGANIGFNLLFVKVYGMTSDGVALGTVLAQYCGLITGIGLFAWKYKSYLKDVSQTLLRKWEAYSRFFKVSGDIFLRTLCLIIVFTFFNVKSAQLGEIQLDANHILLQFFFILSFGVDGFAYAAESLVAKFTGQGKREQLAEAIKWLLIWGAGLGLFITLIYLLFAPWMIGWFTDQEEIIAMAMEYRWWMIGVSAAGTFAFLWDGIYIGATATRAMRNTMFLALVAFILLYLWIEPTSPNTALWAAMTTFMALRSISLWLLSEKAIYPTT